MITDTANIKAIILDIEGTTTSISFVKDVLFPYVKTKLPQYLNAHWNDGDIQAIVEELKTLNVADIRDGLTDVTISGESPEQLRNSVLENILWQMKLDRKTTPLKKLQGLMWVDAYAKEEIRGHVYDDVVPALTKWKSSSKKIYIYSSGSVQAQKLLFKYSEFGDLTKLLDGYFDTLIGAKIVSDSYKTICTGIELEPQEVLFLTDISKEAYAAKEAGLNVLLVTRPGNAPLTAEDCNAFKTVDNFENLFE